MLTKKLILATAAGAALLSSSAFADPRRGHEQHWRHWHPHGYVVVNPAPVVVVPYPYYGYAPAPVYVAPPAPVYSTPAPVYYPAPVYQPAPAVSIGLRIRL